MTNINMNLGIVQGAAQTGEGSVTNPYKLTITSRDAVDPLHPIDSGAEEPGDVGIPTHDTVTINVGVGATEVDGHPIFINGFRIYRLQESDGRSHQTTLTGGAARLTGNDQSDWQIKVNFIEREAVNFDVRNSNAAGHEVDYEWLLYAQDVNGAHYELDPRVVNQSPGN